MDLSAIYYFFYFLVFLSYMYCWCQYFVLYSTKMPLTAIIGFFKYLFVYFEEGSLSMWIQSHDAKKKLSKNQKKKLRDGKERQTRLIQELQDKQKKLKDWKLQTETNIKEYVNNITRPVIMFAEILIFVVGLIITMIAMILIFFVKLQCIQYIVHDMPSAVFSGVRKASLKTWVKSKQIQENKN